MCDHCSKDTPSNVAHCFHCACTVCGQTVDDTPFLRCVVCRSHTHVRCARRGAGRQLGQLIDEESLATTVAPAEEARPLLSSSGYTLGEVVREPYRCCADCAMGVQLYDNARCNRVLSITIEQRCAERWRLVAQKLSLTCPAEAGANICIARPSFPDTAAVTSESDYDDAEWKTCRAAYLQLRYEAWRAYYEAEPFTSAHPSFLLPTCLQLDDVLVGQLSELLSPDGQARRLCALDARTHPVGSVLALPSDALWLDADRLVEGETNSYVAESRDNLVRCVAKVVTLCGDVRVMQPKGKDVAAADTDAANEEMEVSH